jgi:hypothetical protein
MDSGSLRSDRMEEKNTILEHGQMSLIDSVDAETMETNN